MLVELLPLSLPSLVFRSPSLQVLMCGTSLLVSESEQWLRAKTGEVSEWMNGEKRENWVPFWTNNRLMSDTDSDKIFKRLKVLTQWLGERRKVPVFVNGRSLKPQQWWSALAIGYHPATAMIVYFFTPGWLDIHILSHHTTVKWQCGFVCRCVRYHVKACEWVSLSMSQQACQGWWSAALWEWA